MAENSGASGRKKVEEVKKAEEVKHGPRQRSASGDEPEHAASTDARRLDPHIRAVEEADRQDLADLGNMLRRHFDPILEEPVPDKLKAILQRGKTDRSDGGSKR